MSAVRLHVVGQQVLKVFPDIVPCYLLVLTSGGVPKMFEEFRPGGINF